METYSLPEIGVLPEKVYEITDELLDTLLHGEVNSINPSFLMHRLLRKEGSKGTYVPILEEYFPYLQCMLMIRYAKAYTYAEGVERLTKAGYKVSSKGQMVNIFNRMETKLLLKDKTRLAKKQSDARGGKKIVTKARREQLANARKIAEARAAIKRADKERTLAKQKLARQAAKSKMKGSEVRLSRS